MAILLKSKDTKKFSKKLNMAKKKTYFNEKRMIASRFKKPEKWGLQFHTIIIQATTFITFLSA